MRRRCCLLVLAFLAGFSIAETEPLTKKNFNRVVFKSGKPCTFVKFFAPWCSHCQELAPHWEAVEEAHEGSKLLGIESVDCSDGPQGRKELCNTYQAFGLPMLAYFTPPDKRATIYEGNKTEEALLEFATELAVIAHPEERARRYGAALEPIIAMSTSELKAKVSAAENEVDMARHQSMYSLHMMQEAHKKKEKEATIKELEKTAKDSLDKLSELWKTSQNLRLMKAHLRSISSAEDSAGEPEKGTKKKKKKGKKGKKKEEKEEL